MSISPKDIAALSNIPDEMKLLPNFVLWRFEVLESGEKTKVPYMLNGKKASSAKASTWVTYEEAITALPESEMDGIGFVINAACGLTCIDIDDPFKLKADGTPKFNNPAVLLEQQKQIAASFDTYTEVSPSGRGVHIWVKGKTPTGRDKFSIGLYPSGRFMTMTGQVFNGSPIREFPELLNQLWEYLGVPEPLAQESSEAEETISDDEVIRVASGAANGDKFSDLLKGAWEAHYSSQSEADQAFINMIQFYTKSRFQITRIFRNSGLGQRKKALRVKYCEDMITKAFDKELPPVDLDNLKATMQAQFDKLKKPIETPVTEVSEKGFKLTPPNGLVGELARFIYESAPRPVLEIAVIGAIGLMAGVCGRCYNILGTGLNQYILLLADTGTGKESLCNGPDKIMKSICTTVPDAMRFIGPGKISSPQALIKYLAKESSSCVSLFGEFAITLRRMTGLRVEPNQDALKGLVTDLYGKSARDSTVKPIIYSDSDKNTALIESPAFSIIGESVSKPFYKLVNDDLINDGFITRFLIYDCKTIRPDHNKGHKDQRVPERVREQFAALCAYSCQLNNTNSSIEVKLSQEAETLTDNYNLFCDAEHRKATDDTTRDIWSRSFLKMMKLAATLAIGNNYIAPCVSSEDAQWAIDLCLYDANNLLARFDKGEVGVQQLQNEQIKDFKKGVARYVREPWEKIRKQPGTSEATHKHKCIPHGYITSYCSQRLSFKSDRIGHIQAVNSILGSLIASGDIQEIGVDEKIKNGIGRNGKCYAILDIKSFIREVK